MKQKFLACGLAGWCMEILYTAFRSYQSNKNLTLKGNTSLWMFPIYGMACFISPVYHFIQKKSVIIRGGIYTVFIFTGEYLTGSLLRRLDACPWDYSNASLNVKGLIRLDYAPLWFGAGLIFEKIISRH